MKYIPTIEGNEWVTKTTSERGNQGIDNQRKFKEGVLMLETAIDGWSSPNLVHTVLTGADIKTYNLFIDKFKRSMTEASIMFEYKGATETDSRKGQHQHFMWVVDTDNPERLFDLDADYSAVAQVMTSIQRAAPSFNVYVCKPQHHATRSIPLTASTLQDAADYLSYIFKRRSKAPCHRYLSSRSKPARRTCPSHRPARLVKQKHLCNGEF